MATALVLSAGGMFAAWQAGVWMAISNHFQPDLVVGASAGAWNGWAIAGGIAPSRLVEDWLNPATSQIRIFRPVPLYRAAYRLWVRFRPRIPFGLTVADTRHLRVHLIHGECVAWRHLAAACSIPIVFPPVAIEDGRYLDGGVKGALPLWAAQEMGATRVLALDCLTGWPFRILRTILPARRPHPDLEVLPIMPSEPLGSVRDALCWSRHNIERWIRLGEEDGANTVCGAAFTAWSADPNARRLCRL